MEPLLPGSQRGFLAEISVEIFKKSGQLRQSLPSKILRSEVALLISSMNSYYTNLIEGHKTLPKDIERALLEDYSDQPDHERNQRLSAAHVLAEREMNEAIETNPHTNVYSAEFICWLHSRFYSHIPESAWFTETLDGEQFPLKPGHFRDHNVGVGKHTPPDFPELAKFMNRFEVFYSGKNILATNQILSLAAAHHRLAWIHPFSDGNGRVARLQSQAAMKSIGIDCDGLWTLSRGLARERSEYYTQLDAADHKRLNDFDGRGNLSDKNLSNFCVFFLRQILDQIEFMISMLDPFNLTTRMEKYLAFQRVDLDDTLTAHCVKILKALCFDGEIPRGKVQTILGLKSTGARDVIRKALEAKIIKSNSEKGPLRIAFNSDSVEYYFPKLFADLPVN